MMLGLVNVSFSLPEWQAVKMNFFAPVKKTLQAPCNNQSEFYCFFIFKVSPRSFVFDPFVGTGN